jgi:ribonuclease E
MAIEPTERNTSEPAPPKKRATRPSKRRPTNTRSGGSANEKGNSTVPAEGRSEVKEVPAAEKSAATEAVKSDATPPKSKATRSRKKKIASRPKAAEATAAADTEAKGTKPLPAAGTTSSAAAAKKKRPNRRKTTKKGASPAGAAGRDVTVEPRSTSQAGEMTVGLAAAESGKAEAAPPPNRLNDAPTEPQTIIEAQAAFAEVQAASGPAEPSGPAKSNSVEPAPPAAASPGAAPPPANADRGVSGAPGSEQKRRRSRRGKRKSRRGSPERVNREMPSGDATQLPVAELVAGEIREPESTGAVQDASTTGPVGEKREEAPRRDSRSSRRRGRGNRKGGQPQTAAPVTDAETDELESDEDDDRALAGTGAREMMINCTGTDECRIAVLHEGRLEELYIERQSSTSHVNSIYKGRVTNVEPSIQAVFVDFGQAKNGFLHISDVHPQYFPGDKQVTEIVGKKLPHRDRPPIQRCFRRGQEVIVQVTKEGVGTKGPTLTTYLSIPGRFLVMMPGMARMGVSRKIEDEVDRTNMREILNDMSLPDGMGFILRTAGKGRTKRELQRDLNYLTRLWKSITDRVRNTPAPCEVYQESDLVVRTIRDVLSSDFKRIVVDDVNTAETAREFLRIAMPRTQDIVELHADSEPLFHKFGIEQEIESIHARLVPLALGGSIVIEQTEAMVTIDVNSGRYREIDDAEETAYRINMQAAEEIARQLRLRDLGGLIVCDFIDMRYEKHKRAVERCLRDALKKHKERARILRMSQFGLIEMTRQRQGPSIKRSMFKECSHCRGSGLVKTGESMVLEVMRVIQLAAHKPQVRSIGVTVSPEVATLVQNNQRSRIYQIEESSGRKVTIRGELGFGIDQIRCECFDNMNRLIEGSPT